MPAILLVPTSLSAIGSQLFKSMELRDTTTTTKYPVSNPHQGKFKVEVSRYLSNAQYTGNSAKAWYLLAESTDLPVIEVAFLNGQQVIVATHNYLFMKWFDVLKDKSREDQVRFHVLYEPAPKSGVVVESTDEYAKVRPNAIDDAYGEVTEEEISKSMGSLGR